MDLTGAGMLSGAGEAGTHALGALEAGGIQAFLNNERDKFEMARDQMHEQYAGAREQRGYTHAETLAKGNQDFEAGRDQTKIEADISKTSLENQAKHTEAEANREIERKKTESEVKKNEAYADWLKIRNPGGGGTEGAGKQDKNLSATDEAHYKAHLAQANNYYDIAKSPSVVDKSERDALIAMGDKAMANARAIVGGPSIPAGGGIADPFAQGVPKGNIAPAAVTPAAPTAPTTPGLPSPRDPQVERKRPISPRGSTTPKAQLDKISQGQIAYDLQMKREKLAQAKAHGSKQMQQSIQGDIDRLESQLEAGNSLLDSAEKR